MIQYDEYDESTWCPRDDDIVIDFEMPEPLQEIVDDLDRMHEENDWADYMLKRDELNVRSKYMASVGTITQEQFEKLNDKYCAW